MGPEGIILVNPPITTFQQSLTHSALEVLTALKVLTTSVTIRCSCVVIYAGLLQFFLAIYAAGIYRRI